MALPAETGEERPSRPWFKKKRFVIPGAFLLLIVLISALNGGGSSDDRAPVEGGGTTQEAEQDDQETAAEVAAEAEKEAAVKAEEERLAEKQRLADEAAAAAAAAAEAARIGTLSQQNAYVQAKNYLDNMPFSRAGLLAQLTSEYGGQFPLEDAEFGLVRLEAEGAVDWSAEAVEAAQSYQETLPMSRQALIDQLTSEYGSQFTLEQATHAVNTLGL
ncbi:MAG: Ltp family lipoprotein [Cellulomonas sp.]|uniref:Ltp family lipoprotein n=1 Tax=Cellulomonas sp. TaxID=40001 RepID=UPI0019E148E0|nr:Ltp family lipoprotein [Cellulomonas sp.]MBF0688545.1 Ltp family lipoprotein [Cellulomonas sp.]